MTKLTINLPDEFAFRRSGHVFTVKAADIPAEMWQRLAEHGIAQKVGDAAAGKSGQDAVNAMQNVYDALSTGSWGRERNGGTDPVAAEMRRIVVDVLKAKQPDTWKALKDAKDRDERLDAIVAKQSDAKRAKLEEQARERIAKREADRKAKAEAAAKLAGSIDL